MSKESIGGYHEQLPSRHRLGDLYLDIRSNLELLGGPSLEQIRYLRMRGSKLLMMGNHRSNADAPVLEHTLESKGYKDISDSLIFLLGQKLKQSPGTEFFSHAYNHIDVWPPTIQPASPEEKKIAFEMGKSSLRTVREKLGEGRIITIFPEGTRTRDGNMSSFNSSIARYALEENRNEIPDTYVIPFALAGTENIWHVSQARPSLKHTSARVNVGQPFLADDYVMNNGKVDLNSLMTHTQQQVSDLYIEIS